MNQGEIDKGGFREDGTPWNDPLGLKKSGAQWCEYIPELFDSPFLKDVTSHLLKTVPLTLSYQETGNNNLAYLAAFNSGMSSGIIPVTWGK